LINFPTSAGVPLINNCSSLLDYLSVLQSLHNYLSKYPGLKLEAGVLTVGTKGVLFVYIYMKEGEDRNRKGVLFSLYMKEKITDTRLAIPSSSKIQVADNFHRNLIKVRHKSFSRRKFAALFRRIYLRDGGIVVPYKHRRRCGYFP
jgi:hypothetical protein